MQTKGDFIVKSLFAATLLLVISTTIARAQCGEADKKALEAFDHGWTEANARGDRAYLENVYADDYTRTSFTGPANKNEIIEATVKSAARDKANPQNVAKVTADHFIIACSPTTATITHRSVVTTMDGGREQTFYSRGVHFLEKRSGRWQVVSLANHPLDDSINLQLIDEEWNEAGRKKDTAWFERNLTNDFTWVNAQTGALQTRDDWLTAVKNSTSTLEMVESSELKTRVENDLGLLTGVVHVKGRDAQSQPINYNLRFTMTFVKRDGRWLVSAAQATRIQS
jgi:ketosteroid isomerase-like protein